MDNITILEGNDLRELLDQIAARDGFGTIHTLRIHQREDGVAYKVNGGMWSPTIGRRADAGGY